MPIGFRELIPTFKEVKNLMKKINFRKDVVEGKEFNETIYDFINVETDFTKQYKNTISILFRLTPLATKYILYATENMSLDNIYRHDKFNKQLFVEYLKNIDAICNIGSLDKIAVELVEKGLFYSLGKGIYRINPELFWKDTEDNRVNKIKLSLEFEYNEKISVILNKK